MLNIVTYHAHSASIKPDRNWVGYIVLASGEYLGVMFRGYDEAEVIAKATQFWETESKRSINQRVDDDEAEVKAIANDSGRGHHFAGKVWMRHKQSRELVRVPAEQLQQMLDSGYEKSGPRAK